MLPAGWIDDLTRALRAGLDIASGLHARLADVPELVATANAEGRRLHDVRHPTQRIAIGVFERRHGKRLNKVGDDSAGGTCSTARAIARRLTRRSVAAVFCGTGPAGEQHRAEGGTE